MTWLKTYWPHILAALFIIVPAVVTVLRKHPDSPGATKAASIFEIIMEFLSILHPQGTSKLLKMPFTRSKLGPNDPTKYNTKHGTALVLLVALALGSSSCCLFKAGTCKSAYGNCAAEKIKGEFPDVLNVVEAALSGSTPEIVMKSLKLLEGLGVGLVVCAVTEADAKYAPASQPDKKMSASLKAQRISSNAKAYLKTKGVQ